MVDKQLADEPYYHGLLPREDIKAMLKQNGEFLIRTAEPVVGQPRAFVLSIMVQQEIEDLGIKHYVIQRTFNNKYLIERYTFDSIPEMIRHHMSQRDSISKFNDGVILRTPILRQAWELQHDQVECTKKLGEGAFGEVHRGKLRLANGVKVEVAVKMAKLEVLTKDQIKDVMREARLMRHFDHPNVVKFYGVGAGQEPLLLVMELVDGGALNAYLQRRQQPQRKKCEMCAGAAFGLEYVHSMNIIHRDVAARNCLVQGDGHLKLSDFGLTRDGPVYQMQMSKPVPVRWLAPECLRVGLYTSKSDVFAYGILCWEIFNNGAEPFAGLTPTEVAARVKDGYRLALGFEVPPDVNTMLVSKCWLDKFADRFTMSDVAKHWERFHNIQRPTARAAQPTAHQSPSITPDSGGGFTPFAVTPALGLKERMMSGSNDSYDRNAERMAAAVDRARDVSSKAPRRRRLPLRVLPDRDSSSTKQRISSKERKRDTRLSIKERQNPKKSGRQLKKPLK